MSCNLHSTMFLLIREAAEGLNILAQAFTFHNVSINSRLV